MKKILLIVLVLIVGCAKEPEPINLETLVETENDVYYTKDTNKPYTGGVFALYENREKQIEGYLKDGNKDSKWTYYHESGQISSEENFKDGERDGKWTSYDILGQIEKEENYKEGEKDGKTTLYYKSGQIEEEENYKDGKKDGKWVWYNESNIINGEGNYKAGELVGKWIYYMKDGNISEVPISQTIMTGGKLFKINEDESFSGIIYDNYTNGQRKYEGNYRNGKPNGLLVYWHNNGNKMREGQLKDGMPVGRWITYTEDGSIQKTFDH